MNPKNRNTVPLLLLLAACGQPSTTGMPIQVTPAEYLTTMTLSDVHDGDRIDLVRPPQGGFVVFMGAKVKGLDERTVELRGRLRDPMTGNVVGEDARNVTLMPSPDDAQVLIPDLRTFGTVANIPMCPALGLPALYDRPFVLEVVVTGLTSMRAGTAKIMAIPSCRQTDSTVQMACQCECGADYQPGHCT